MGQESREQQLLKERVCLCQQLTIGFVHGTNESNQEFISLGRHHVIASQECTADML